MSVRAVRYESDTVLWARKGPCGFEGILPPLARDRLLLPPGTYDVLLTNEVFEDSLEETKDRGFF